MKHEVKSVTLSCDCCHEEYRNDDGFLCYVGDDDGSQIWDDADKDGWLEFGGKHYCPKCYKEDENNENIIITKDGHKYEWETEEEISHIQQMSQFMDEMCRLQDSMPRDIVPVMVENMKGQAPEPYTRYTYDDNGQPIIKKGI